MGYQKFPDNHAHKGKPHVDFQSVEDTGDIGGKDNFCQHLPLCATKNLYQLDAFFIYLQKTIQDGEDGNNNRSQQSHKNDRALVIPEPDNDDRSQGGFGQRIEDHQIGLCHIRDKAIPPEENCCQCSKNRSQKKAGYGFPKGGADMQEEGSILHHFSGRSQHTGGLTEQEGVDPTLSGGDLPEKEKGDQQNDLQS